MKIVDGVDHEEGEACEREEVGTVPRDDDQHYVGEDPQTEGDPGKWKSLNSEKCRMKLAVQTRTNNGSCCNTRSLHLTWGQREEVPGTWY